MTFRSDVSVNWAVSPRIATVAAPSTTISIQDIVDTFRTLEAELGALDDFSLLDAAGKDYLGVEEGVTKRVGITLRLLNTRMAFEARPPPTYVQCRITGGNLVAADEAGDPMNPVEPTAYTQVVIEQSTSPSLLVTSGTPEEIADAVWDEAKAGHVGAGSFGEEVQSHASQATADEILASTDNKMEIVGTELWLYDSAGTVVLKKWPLTDKDGNSVVLQGTGPANRGVRTL